MILNLAVQSNAMQPHLVGPSTTRLDHRALTADDAESFYALNSHPDVMRYTGEPPIQSLEQAQQAIADYPDFKTIGYGRWGCFYKPTGELIGFCGLKYLPELDEVDIGFRYLPAYWGRGLATEAALACIDFGFDTLRLERIIGLVLEQNVASIRVLEKIGMQQNGRTLCEVLDALRFEISRTDRTAQTTA